MKLNDFELEVYFARHEFSAPYLLAQSDCESMSVRELLSLEPGSEQGLLDLRLGYTETWGDPGLRELAAGLYQNMSAADVLVLHGAQEGIFLYMNAVLEEGDHAVVMFPNYPSAYEVIRGIPGCTFSRWEIRDDGKGWTLDLSELENLITPRTKLVAVNSPNNPTGFTLTNRQMEEVAAVCRKHGLYLFCDEVYKGLELDGESRKWAADMYEKALSLGVMSKAYGMPGLRLGWAVSKDRELLDKMVRLKHYTTICDAGPSEYLSRIALRHSEQLLERSRAVIRENLETAGVFFRKHASVFASRPIPAGSVAFHKLLADMDISDFCSLAVRKKGVLLLPGYVYGVKEPYFRMGYGRKSFAENLGKLDEFLIEEGFSQETTPGLSPFVSRTDDQKEAF